MGTKHVLISSTGEGASKVQGHGCKSEAIDIILSSHVSAFCR